MEKESSKWQCDSDELNERVKKKKRKKDLEVLRKNALAAKRNLRGKVAVPKKQESNFMKTINAFASQRKKIETAAQCNNLLLKTKPITKDQVKTVRKLMYNRGVFLGGMKSETIERPSNSQQKLKNAILKDDLLQILQTRRRINQENNRKVLKKNENPRLEMEVENILKGSNESSISNTSTEDDDVQSLEKLMRLSPILGAVKNKRKVISIKSDDSTTMQHMPQKAKPLPKTKHLIKEEKCKRRLFVNENLNNNRMKKTNNDYVHDTSKQRFSSEKLTPENVIFFAEHVQRKNVEKASKNHNDCRIDSTDPRIIKCYIQTCKIIAYTGFKDIFWNEAEDPLKIAKTNLKATYANTFKNCLLRQKLKSEGSIDSTDRTTTSSNSEVMLEPDSAVGRTLKKNLEVKHVAQSQKNNLDKFTHELEENNLAENNIMKRKRVPSSKGDYSEVENPSSLKVNADSKSVKLTSLMDSIDPERQEIIARYLKDVITNNVKESEQNALYNQQNATREPHHNRMERKQSFHNNSAEETYFIQKNTKHVPSILRKNRTFNNVSEEKVYKERCRKPEVLFNKQIMFDKNMVQKLSTECTPDYGNSLFNQLQEAPKCKYVHMNAKYNQPARINLPQVQNNRQPKNSVSDQYIFSSPTIIAQNFQVSPMNQDLIQNVSNNEHNFHKYQLSQNNCEQTSDCMIKMASFGKLLERADRLTLLSSQNCSQESTEHIHSSQDTHCKSQPNYYIHQQNSYDEYLNQNNHMTINNLPLSQPLDNARNHGHYHARNVMKNIQTVPSIDYCFQNNERCNCCSNNSSEIYKKQNLQEQLPMQRVCQPIKFLAVEGNLVPQRQAIYSSNNDSSYIYPHKTLNPNQQYNELIKSDTREVFDKTLCTSLSSHCHSYGVPQSIDSSDFEYHNIIISNPQRSLNYDRQIVPSNRNLVNPVPISVANQYFNVQESMPMHQSINNQQCMRQHMNVQMSSPSYPYPQRCQHNHCNKECKINNVYIPQMIHNIHPIGP